MRRFQNRSQAGKLLAPKLHNYQNHEKTIVLALPRGGVPVAFEIAQSLNLPLDVFIVRKLGFPGNKEYAMGAIASKGIRVLNPEVPHLSKEVLEAVTAQEQIELARRERLYRHNRPPLDLCGYTVILVDDGIATGSTIHAAVWAIRQQNPARIVIATPVSPTEIEHKLLTEVDEMICLLTPDPFYAVGTWYEQFEQTTDEEIQHLLRY